jgi:hypothetical protein
MTTRKELTSTWLARREEAARNAAAATTTKTKTATAGDDDREQRRLAAMFNLTEEQFTTGQPVSDGRIVCDEHDAGLRDDERAWTDGEYDPHLDGYPLFSPEGLAAIATDPEYQRRILMAVNSHAALVAALEQAHELIYVGVSDRKMLSQSSLYRVVDVIAEALRQARGGE